MTDLSNEDRTAIQRIWHKDHKMLTPALTEAYIAGLAAGRERAIEECAKLAGSYGPKVPVLGTEIAAAIRALNGPAASAGES